MACRYFSHVQLSVEGNELCRQQGKKGGGKLEIGMNAMGKYSRSCTQLEIVAALSVYENNGFCLELFLPTTQDCIDFWKENNFINELDYYK